MPTLTITPSNVRGQDGAAPLARVGDPDTMWGDGSDATYAADYGAVNGTGVGTLFGDIAPFAATINSAYASARVAMSHSPRISLGVADYLDDNVISWSRAGLDTTGPPYWDRVDLAATDTPQNLTLQFGDPDTGAAMTSGQLTALFASGFTVLAVSAPTDSTDNLAQVTVYEFTVTIDYTPTGPPPTVVLPHRRQFPRGNDGYGVRGARRVFPRGTSRQGSNRTTGIL